MLYSSRVVPLFVPGGMPANVLTWDKLTTDLKITSHTKSHCNGTVKSSYLKSSHGIYYTPNPVKSVGGLCKYSMNCDNQNSRGIIGKTLARNTRTFDPRKENWEISCKVDQFTFYMTCGNGCKIHQGHPPLASEEMTFPAKLVDVKYMQLAYTMANNSPRPGLVFWVLKDSYDICLTR